MTPPATSIYQKTASQLTGRHRVKLTQAFIYHRLHRKSIWPASPQRAPCPYELGNVSSVATSELHPMDDICYAVGAQGGMNIGTWSAGRGS
jgi:hypothetical protein